MVRIQVIHRLDDEALKRLAAADDAVEAARKRSRRARKVYLEARGPREKDEWALALQEERVLDDARWIMFRKYFLELSLD